MTEEFRPTLLLSMPQLQDPNFARTVVLLCDFAPEGAFGLVLNRPTEMPATSMVKLDPPIVGGNGMPLCIGGPVEPERGWILSGTRPKRTSTAKSRKVSVLVHVAHRPAPGAVDAAGAATCEGAGRIRRVGTRPAGHGARAFRLAHGRRGARSGVRGRVRLDVGHRDQTARR